jgi:hypothetical protein
MFIISRGITQFPDSALELENHVWYNLFARRESLYLDLEIDSPIYLLVKNSNNVERLYLGKVLRILKMPFNHREMMLDRLLGFGYWPYQGDKYYATKEHMTKGYMLCFKLTDVKKLDINLDNRPRLNRAGYLNIGPLGNQ